ncbi:myb domain protein [Abeliophyllum distichum]|uniref:Myb domain protein n=1 Tax=Abeliophyllum distichum TaxID=126358 RepID=A0ABD1PDL8_9LAMI
MSTILAMLHRILPPPEAKTQLVEGTHLLEMTSSTIMNIRVTSPARTSSKGKWNTEEDEILRDAVRRFNGKSWKGIANCLPGRTDVQCLHRWQKVINPDVNKGPWTEEEDDVLIELVGKQGNKKWSEIAKQLRGRIGKQCRDRWHNHLNPEIKKAAWTKEEDMILINAHAIYGNKWAKMAKLLPGRPENSIKNRWNCSLKKKLVNSMASGFDSNHPGYDVPTMHTPGSHCLSNQKVDNQRNGDSCSLDLIIGSPDTTQSHLQSSEKGSSTNGSISTDLLEAKQPKVLDHGYSHKHELTGSSPQGVPSKYQSCQQEAFRGLCYEPLWEDNLKNFLSTGRLTCTDSYIRPPHNPISTPSTSNVKALSVSCSSPESILKTAAGSYDNKPSIIRKRAIQTSQARSKSPFGDISTSDKIIDSLSNMLQGEHENPNTGDDQYQALRQALHSPVKYQKLEKNAAIKSVRSMDHIHFGI